MCVCWRERVYAQIHTHLVKDIYWLLLEWEEEWKEEREWHGYCTAYHIYSMQHLHLLKLYFTRIIINISQTNGSLMWFRCYCWWVLFSIHRCNSEVAFTVETDSFFLFYIWRGLEKGGGKGVLVGRWFILLAKTELPKSRMGNFSPKQRIKLCSNWIDSISFIMRIL